VEPKHSTGTVPRPRSWSVNRPAISPSIRTAGQARSRPKARTVRHHPWERPRSRPAIRRPVRCRAGLDQIRSGEPMPRRTSPGGRRLGRRQASGHSRSSAVCRVPATCPPRLRPVQGFRSPATLHGSALQGQPPVRPGQLVTVQERLRTVPRPARQAPQQPTLGPPVPTPQVRKRVECLRRPLSGSACLRRGAGPAPLGPDGTSRLHRRPCQPPVERPGSQGNRDSPAAAGTPSRSRPPGVATPAGGIPAVTAASPPDPTKVGAGRWMREPRSMRVDRGLRAHPQVGRRPAARRYLGTGAGRGLRGHRGPGMNPGGRGCLGMRADPGPPGHPKVVATPGT
jgi:hypothetical protein